MLALPRDFLPQSLLPYHGEVTSPPPLLFTQTYLSRFTLPAANLNLLLLGSYLPPAGILPRQEN